MTNLLLILLLVVGCSPTEYSSKDCAGVENGTASIDDCGLCTGCDTGLEANYLKDCAGECGGDALEDCNGICGGSAIADCTDCTGNFNPCGDGTNDCDEFNNYTDDYCGSCSVHLWGSCYDIEQTTLLDEFAFAGLTGVIPPEIGHLVNLGILKLQNNQLPQ